MAAPVADSVFDVAYWFLDRALEEGEYLQPQKLQRLCYLAQAYYAVATHGGQLMPALFLADDTGPLEPSLYRAMEIQRPTIYTQPLPDRAKQMLDSIWRRFGAHKADHLTRILRNHPPYADAYAKGPRSEITLRSMVAFYGDKNRQDAPTVQEVMRPRVMRSHTGRPVSVKAWIPKAAKPKKTS